MNAASAARPARTVLVTGAAKRLGREIALALAGAGWQVAIHYRSSGLEAQQTLDDCRRGGMRCETFAADLASEDEARALLGKVVAAFGSVDAVVNSASLFQHDSFASLGAASLDAHMR